MKMLIAIVILLSATWAQAHCFVSRAGEYICHEPPTNLPSPAPQEKPAVHGMLVFGEKTVYFSHLPMFHQPHDYQVIFVPKLDEETKSFYLADKQNHPEAKYYTFVPELMILPEVIQGAKVFKGDLYRGHFERGGVLVKKGITVQVEQLVYFKKFNPKDEKPKTPSYILFGDTEESWLAHVITVKPDFDHILAIKNENGKKVVETLYSETGDLEM